MMIDPELKYCPQCHDEYRPDIEECAACAVPLLTGARMLEIEREREQQKALRRGEIAPDDKIVSIQGGSLPDMRRLAELLNAERIGTRLVADEKTCGSNCCPTTFFLQVRQEEAAEALEIVEAEHQRVTRLDHHDHTYADEVFNPHAGEATCPACGYRFSTMIATCPDCGLFFG